jgi:secreted trypsin-like serine protease
MNSSQFINFYLITSVGLIQTSVIMTFSATVQSIFLGDTMIGSGVAARVSGWGSTSQDLGPTSETLRTLETSTLSLAECHARHTYWNAERITMSHLCTNNAYGEGFCQTGAGGPLVWNSHLIGIASWNVPCALGFPVSSFLIGLIGLN